MTFEKLQIIGNYLVRDLWDKKDLYVSNNFVNLEVKPHGARLVKLSKKE